MSSCLSNLRTSACKNYLKGVHTADSNGQIAWQLELKQGHKLNNLLVRLYIHVHSLIVLFLYELLRLHEDFEWNYVWMEVVSCFYLVVKYLGNSMGNLTDLISLDLSKNIMVVLGPLHTQN